MNLVFAYGIAAFLISAVFYIVLHPQVFYYKSRRKRVGYFGAIFIFILAILVCTTTPA